MQQNAEFTHSSLFYVMTHSGHHVVFPITCSFRFIVQYMVRNPCWYRGAESMYLLQRNVEWVGLDLVGFQNHETKIGDIQVWGQQNK